LLVQTKLGRPAKVAMMTWASAPMKGLFMLTLSATVVPELMAQPPTSAPILVAPASEACPVMSDLQTGVYLITEPWSLMRSIRIVQKNRLYDASAEVGFANLNVLSTAAPTPDPFATGMGQYLADDPAWTTTGTISASFATLAVEYELSTSAEGSEPVQLISSLANPFAFWHTTQNVYDCTKTKLGSVIYDYKLSDFLWFRPHYGTHQVYDATNNHIADLVEQPGTRLRFLGMWQSFVILQDRSGVPLASMRRPSGGWSLGPFGEAFDVHVNVEFHGSVPVAMSPDFLTLVMANALSAGCRFGPYYSLIARAVALVLTPLVLLFLFLRWLCRAKEVPHPSTLITMFNKIDNLNAGSVDGYAGWISRDQLETAIQKNDVIDPREMSTLLPNEATNTNKGTSWWAGCGRGCRTAPK